MRQIPGLVGYWATEMGEIVSTRDGERVITQRLKDGYYCVTLGVVLDGKRCRRRHSVHRLVALAFIGLPPEDKEHTRHLNGVPTDNRASNLAWGTPTENSQDAVRHGTLGKGERSRRKKLTATQVSDIRSRIARGEPTASIATEFGVTRYYPKALARGRGWPSASGQAPGD